MSNVPEFLFSPDALDPVTQALVIDESPTWQDDKKADGFRVLLTETHVAVQIRVDEDEHMVTIPVLALLGALEEWGKTRGN